MAACDVLIMPWRQNDWIRSCNPVKLKEYLALGFPIVTMRFSAIRRYEGLVYVAESHEQFLAALDRALREADPGMAERRRAAVLQCGWDRIAERVGGLLGIDAG